MPPIPADKDKERRSAANGSSLLDDEPDLLGGSPTKETMAPLVEEQDSDYV